MENNNGIIAYWIGLTLAAIAATMLTGGIFKWILFIIGAVLIGFFCYRQIDEAEI